MKKTIRRTRIYQNIVRVTRLLKSFGVKPSSFVITSLLSFLASLCEGISIALLIPAVKGLFEGNFLFAEKIPVLGVLLSYFFNFFGRRQAVIFSVILALIFIAIVLKHIFMCTSGLVMKSLTLKITHNMRRKIYARYLSFGKLFFDRSSYGYLYTVLMNFSQQLTSAVMLINSTLFSAFSLLVYFGIMVSISWRVSIFTLLIFPVLHFSVSWIIKKIRKTSLDLSKARIVFTHKISNALACIPLVKAYTNEENETKWFSHASESVNRYSFSMAKKTGVIGPIQGVVTTIMMFMVVGFMAYLLVKRNIGDMAAFMAFFILLRRLSAYASIANNIRKSLASLKGPFNHVKHIFDDKDKFFIKSGTKKLTTIEKGIEFNSLYFKYPGGVEALKNINLFIKKGQTTAIVGSTGAGKSTIINLIIRYYDASRGSLRIDGVDIRDYTIESLRSNIALVSQDAYLLNAPLGINLKYGLRDEIPDSVFKEAIRLSKLDEFINKLPDGLQTEIGDRGIRLSGGEKQRISICRAILKKTSIVLLDEATSALDSITERKIQEALDNLTKSTTTVVVAHRLSTIKHADNIVVVEDGSIVEEGNLETLLDKKGIFYLYWQEQKFF